MQCSGNVFSILTIVLGALGGCAKQEPPSAIVQKMEQAGAGDLSSVSQTNIQDWFAKHKDLAYDIDDLCKPIRDKASAEWGQTTEGRVCNAAHQLALTRSVSGAR